MPKSKRKTIRIRRKPEEIEAILAAYDASGFPLNEFAHSHRLAASTLCGWLRKRRRTQAKSEQFVQLVGTAESTNLLIEDDRGIRPGDFDLSLEQGAHGVRRLRVGSGFQPQELTALLEVLNTYRRQD